MDTDPKGKSPTENTETERPLAMTYLYCGRCDMFTPTETMFGTPATECFNCGRPAEKAETCPNCHEQIADAVMEDRWGTRFCSVWCCDFYHESVHAEMREK